MGDDVENDMVGGLADLRPCSGCEAMRCDARRCEARRGGQRAFLMIVVLVIAIIIPIAHAAGTMRFSEAPVIAGRHSLPRNMAEALSSRNLRLFQSSGRPLLVRCLTLSTTAVGIGRRFFHNPVVADGLLNGVPRD